MNYLLLAVLLVIWCGGVVVIMGVTLLLQGFWGGERRRLKREHREFERELLREIARHR